MGYKLSGKAAGDLENLYVFGVDTFGIDRAERYVAGLLETLAFLSDNPRAPRVRPSLGASTRSHPYRSHLIFYREIGDDILIQRIRHGREDWP